MSLPPEEELFVLLDADEERFGLGEPPDYQWHVDHPGASPTIDGVQELAEKGYVQIVEERDEPENRDYVWAITTEEGRARARSLLRDGIEPKPARL